jgi:hypothetical protein
VNLGVTRVGSTSRMAFALVDASYLLGMIVFLPKKKVRIKPG